MTSAELRCMYAAIKNEEYAQRVKAEIRKSALSRAARLIEHEADAIMAVAQMTDPRVKMAFTAFAKRVRRLV